MDILEQHCTCGVCLDLFDSNINLPRSLHCGHTFCDRCIQHLKESEMGRERILRCPSCKSTQYVSTNPLPVNYQILGLADDLRTKRETNQRWSLRKPHRDGTKCAECSVPPKISSLRVCRTCESSPLLCPDCALNSHNGHSFLSYESFLASKQCGESLEKLQVSCENLKFHTRDLFTRVISSIDKLRTKCDTLSVAPSLRALSNENPIEALRKSDRMIEVIDKSSERIAEKLMEAEMFIEDQLSVLSDDEANRGNGAPPVPPRRRLPPLMGKSLNDRYSSGFSLVTTITCLIYLVSFFPLFVFFIISIALLYFVIYPWYSQYGNEVVNDNLKEEVIEISQ